MINAARRIAKYNAKNQSSLQDPVLSAMQSIQQANFAAYEADFYPKQVQLRAILAALAITPNYIAAYEAFHGEVYHTSKVSNGLMAVTQCAILVTKYSAHLGVPAATNLKAICNQIYGIIVP